MTKPPKKIWIYKWLLLAAFLLASPVHADEITDFSTTAAGNTSDDWGMKENIAPSDVNNNYREALAIIARWHKDTNTSVVSYGASNAYRITPNRTISALGDGLLFAFETHAANTGAVTFQVGSTAAKAVKKSNDVDLASGDLEANQKVIVAYNATDDVYEMLTQTAAATLSDPMTTRGDIIVRNSSNVTDRLAVGAANTVLTSDGTDATWGGLGKQTIWIPADACTPTTSNGAATAAAQETTAGRPDIRYLAFDTSSDEHCQFNVSFPPSWDEGTVTARIFWSQGGADSGTVTWALQGVSVSDNDTFDVAYGTAVTVGDTAHATTEDLMVTSETGAATIAGTPAANDNTVFRIFRDVSEADTLAADAWLVGVQLFYTTDVATDD